MKVVHILLGKANPDRANGVNKVVHHLASQGQAAGDRPEVWGITHSPAEPGHKPPYHLKLFPRERVRFSISPTLAAAIGELADGNTVVHLHSVFVPEFWALARRLRANGVPWVLSPHGGYSTGGLRRRQLIKRTYLQWFERSVISGASRIHVLGEMEERDLACIAPPGKLVLVPNGCVPECPAAEFLEGAYPEEPSFVFCGRLDQEHKGIDTAIDAFELYAASGGIGRFHIVGDGRDREALERRVAKCEASQRVTFHGSLFGEQKLDRLRRSHAFVQLSRWEGMPVACLEAASLGLPLMVTEETNLASYVRKWGSGEVITSRHPPEIARSMHRIEQGFRERNLHAVGRRAAEMARCEFNWPKVYDALVRTLYNPLATS